MTFSTQSNRKPRVVTVCSFGGDNAQVGTKNLGLGLGLMSFQCAIPSIELGKGSAQQIDLPAPQKSEENSPKPSLSSGTLFPLFHLPDVPPPPMGSSFCCVLGQLQRGSNYFSARVEGLRLLL